MSETPKFKKGTVLRLNSGGPKMTVLLETNDGKASCQWFDRNGKMHKGDFDLEALSEFKKPW